MSSLKAALAWSGADATLSVFVVSSEAITPDYLASLPRPLPDHIRTYDLEDEGSMLGGRHVQEFDLVWKELPDHLEEIVRMCLQEMLAKGAEVAWFAFEGSFSYDYLLHPDIARYNQKLWIE